MTTIPLVTDVGPTSCASCRRSTGDNGRALLSPCLDCHPRGVPCASCGRSTGLSTFGSTCYSCWTPSVAATPSSTYAGDEPDPAAAMAVGLFATTEGDNE